VDAPPDDRRGCARQRLRLRELSGSSTPPSTAADAEAVADADVDAGPISPCTTPHLLCADFESPGLVEDAGPFQKEIADEAGTTLGEEQVSARDLFDEGCEEVLAVEDAGAERNAGVASWIGDEAPERQRDPAMVLHPAEERGDLRRVTLAQVGHDVLVRPPELEFLGVGLAHRLALGAPRAAAAAPGVVVVVRDFVDERGEHLHPEERLDDGAIGARRVVDVRREADREHRAELGTNTSRQSNEGWPRPPIRTRGGRTISGRRRARNQACRRYS
jgi:hypothetical protein